VAEVVEVGIYLAFGTTIVNDKWLLVCDRPALLLDEGVYPFPVF
jgi:hypothetical protein